MRPIRLTPSRAAALAGRMLTPVEAFYSRNHGPVPSVDPRAWRLRVGGLVAGRWSYRWMTCSRPTLRRS